MQDQIDWSSLLGGDRQPFDPRPALDAWRRGGGVTASKELWERLLHQGNVDTAAYAAVPELIQIVENAPTADWNAYALVASIEEARLSTQNPPLPLSWIGPYRAAWKTILTPALRDLASAEDDVAVRSIMAAIAHAKGQRLLAQFAMLTQDEQRELLRD
ncbi:hypothetical protein [Hyphomicrobium sp. CS1BSMeth3]|uniref:hypothetical protein n=1 Tax=Hyphomicrobium sp. CS1BSMeth3 TaxID=1892844 RepID=UPI0009F94C78|nr:hypothetical protein [Hyphomicrobium sp. CS1BSMeth3]